MGSSVQPQPTDPVQAYLQKYGKGGGSASAIPSTVSESTKVDPVATYLSKYGKPDSTPPLAQRVAETISSGLPGGRGLVALGTGLADLVTGKGIDASVMDANESLKTQQKDVASMPWYARIPLQVVGGAPLAAATAPAGLLGGGALFGAAAGADRPASSLSDVAKNTVIGSATGAIASKGAQLIGHGLSNIADRTGVSDAVGNLISKVDPESGAAIGTRGQVNDALSERQNVLGVLGDNGQTAAKQQLDRIAATKAQAKTLYDAARNDRQVIQDPELQQLLADPQIQKAYQSASVVRAASGNPLPQVAAPEQVPLALQKMGVSQARYAELQAVGQARAYPVGRPALGGPSIAYHGTSVPFDNFDPAIANPNALYGPGHYFTENPTVASSYATTKGAQVAPNVRMASLDIKKPFDADALFGDDENYDRVSDSPDIFRILATAQQLRPNQDWDEAASMLDARANESNITGRDIYKVLSKTVDENGIEAKRAAANEILQQSGYDGITHIGGQTTGGTPHRVWVAFSPEQIKPPVMQSARIPALSGTDILPPELMGERTNGIDVPDPDVLARTKRYLYQAATGNQNSPLPLKQDEAQALLPKIDAIRQKLHTLSPAWQQADQFYSGAKGEEEAFANGVNAFRNAANTTGETLDEKSPEAMIKAISEPRFANEPPEAMAARAEAFRQGMRSAAADQIRSTEVDRGGRAILGKSMFAPTQAGQQVRSLMFENPEQAKSLESLLAQGQGKVAAMGSAPTGMGNMTPVGKFAAVRAAMRMFQPTDLLKTPQGAERLSELLGDPSLLRNELEAANGNPVTRLGPNLPKILGGSLPGIGNPGPATYQPGDYLARLLGITAGGQVAR